MSWTLHFLTRYQLLKDNIDKIQAIQKGLPESTEAMLEEDHLTQALIRNASTPNIRIKMLIVLLLKCPSFAGNP